MVTKSFKTLDEQIDILKNKRLDIGDVDYTKNVLLRENYFFLNGYRHLFMDPSNTKLFLEGTRFEELYALFLFDRTLRNIMFKYILVIENNLKSIISYVLSKKYGYKEKEYLKAKNFSPDPDKQKQISDLLNKMKRQIRVNGSQHSATLHYSSNYGYIPLWILVKVLSFGIVSELYTILQKDDQKEVSEIYKISVNNLNDYLPLLANYRNLCAHEDILFENKTQKAISDTIIHEKLNINKIDDEYIYGKNDLFALVIILKQMLSKDDFKKMINELESATDNLNYHITTIKIEKVLNRMGFPLNWKEIANIERSF